MIILFNFLLKLYLCHSFKFFVLNYFFLIFLLKLAESLFIKNIFIIKFIIYLILYNYFEKKK